MVARIGQLRLPVEQHLVCAPPADRRAYLVVCPQCGAKPGGCCEERDRYKRRVQLLLVHPERRPAPRRGRR